MYGIWVAVWHQSPTEFWLSTPGQFYAAYDQWIEDSSRDLLTAGTITATLLNVNRSKRGKTYSAEDVFPSLRGLKPVPTREQLIAKVKKAFGYPGRKESG